MNPQLTVVMPVRNEDMATATVYRAYATAGEPIAVIAVLDGDPRRYDWPDPPPGCAFRVLRVEPQTGNCFCRDAGIMAAETDAVVLVDAHLNWHDGKPWGGLVHEAVTAEPTAVYCHPMVSLRATDMELHAGHSRYWACQIAYSDRDSNGRHNMFPVKWGGPRAEIVKAAVARGETCETQVILGGCYALSRARYIALGRPWQHSRGWGTSEQTISIPNSMMGGRQMVLPLEVGHCYRHDGAPYRSQIWHLFYNQRRLLLMLPIPEAERTRLYQHHERNSGAGLNHLDRGAIEQALAMQTWPRYGTETAWIEYATKWDMQWWKEGAK